MLDYKNQEHFLKPIIEAINKGQLILFVGSGVSKLCGLPLWKELAKSLLMHCAEDPKCSTFSYRDFDEILNYIDDERELISIAKNILNKAYKDDETFYNLLCKQLTPKDENHKDNLKMQSLLFSFADTIITTNADQILDNQLNSENVIYNVADFEKYKIEGVHKVIHIHGSINDCNSLVFTTAEYLLRYADNKFRKSITNIFSSTSPYVVLFVGYGFREMQLLDFLVNVESKEIREKKTFYLNGYFSNQENIFDVESEYYKTYGVTLVSYYRDAKNYHGLFDALEYIRDEAAKKSLKNFRKINKLVDIINQEPNENSVQTLENEYIFQSETFKTHILESVSKSSFAKQWTESIVSSSKLSKEIFNVDNLVEGEPFINSFSGVPFPGLALLANIDVFSNDTKSFYYSFIKDVVKKYATDNKLFSNSIAYKSFLKLIFSREEFLIDKEISNDIYTFLNSFVKNAPEPDIWMLFASYKDDILKIHSQTPIKCLVGLMLKTLSKMNNVVSYEFSQFFNAYSDSFCSNFPKSGIKRLISKLEEISSSFYSRDVISVEIDKKEGSVDAYSYLNKWLSKVIKNLKNDDANKLFDYLIASCDDLKCIIAIYVANIHFSSLKKKFIENLNSFN